MGVCPEGMYIQLSYFVHFLKGPLKGFVQVSVVNADGQNYVSTVVS